MPDDTLNITAAELRILKILWRIGSGTVRDVKEQLAAESEEPPAYTTVMTLMNQLAAKSALAVDRGRQPFVYSPAVQRENVLTQRLKQFLNTVFDGQAGELVLRLVATENLSDLEQGHVVEAAIGIGLRSRDQAGNEARAHIGKVGGDRIGERQFRLAAAEQFGAGTRDERPGHRLDHGARR